MKMRKIAMKMRKIARKEEVSCVFLRELEVGGGLGTLGRTTITGTNEEPSWILGIP